MCVWSSLKKGYSLSLLLSFCSNGVLCCQKCHSTSKLYLNEVSCVCRDMYHFQNVCELTWCKLIITSEVKREQSSSCLSMRSFSDRYLNIWKEEKLFLSIYLSISLYIYLSIYPSIYLYRFYWITLYIMVFWCKITMDLNWILWVIFIEFLSFNQYYISTFSILSQ